MKIYDCFLFHDETMLLEIRFNILNKFVEKFVISEAKYLHNGKKKNLNFKINDYPDFKNKIEYIVVDDLPPDILIEKDNDDKTVKNNKKLINGQRRETYQRNRLLDVIKTVDDEDFIIISDSDEIPNIQKIYGQNIDNDIIFFKQKMFYYKFNLYYENYNWYGSKGTKKKNFLSPQWIRSIKNKNYPFWRVDTNFSKKKYRNIRFIEDGGWHFTCIKTPEGVHEKLLSFSHYPDYESSNISLEDLKQTIFDKKALYDHTKDRTSQSKWLSDIKLKKIDDRFLPDYLISKRSNYKDWFEV